MFWLKRYGHWLLTLFVAFVFIQSLFFKFTGAPETVYIFQVKLRCWVPPWVWVSSVVPSFFTCSRHWAWPS